MKSKAFAVLGILGLMCSIIMCVCVTGHAGNQDGSEKLRYEVVQHDQGNDGAGVFLTDRKSNELISIYNGKDGSFVAFYGKEKQRGSMPKLAFSADGIQIVDSSGKVKHIDLGELAKLDIRTD